MQIVTKYIYSRKKFLSTNIRKIFFVSKQQSWDLTTKVSHTLMQT